MLCVFFLLRPLRTSRTKRPVVHGNKLVKQTTNQTAKPGNGYENHLRMMWTMEFRKDAQRENKHEIWAITIYLEPK